MTAHDRLEWKTLHPGKLEHAVLLRGKFHGDGPLDRTRPALCGYGDPGGRVPELVQARGTRCLRCARLAGQEPLP